MVLRKTPFPGGCIEDAFDGERLYFIEVGGANDGVGAGEGTFTSFTSK